MIDFNKPVQTRDGRKVEIKDQRLSGGYPILGVVTDKDGERFYETWDIAGNHRSEYTNKPLDLINVPERVELWRAIYPPGRNTSGYPYQSLMAAQDSAGSHVCGFERITYEDGKPVAVALEDCK